MNVTVLGSGLVGSAIAKDLSKDNRHNITAVDINETALSNLNGHGIKCIPADVSNLTTLQNVIADSDIVVNAVPGGLGFLSLKNIISSGKNVVDIAFYEQDPFLLDELASENNVTALVDFGVSPGISNLLIGSSKINFDKINNLEIYVGGLPLKREQPFEYKAVFSPADVIEEYIRPARLIENGKEIIKPALSEVELMDFPGVGTLQAFNSDGLRSLLKTTDIPNMKEKTLRYPEHAEKIELLKNIGLFSKDYIELNSIKVKPIDLISKLLFPMWQMQSGDKDFTVLKVIIRGEKNNLNCQIEYLLIDYFDDETGIHSMARTTGYMAAMGVRLLADNLYSRKGICSPEFVGEDIASAKYILQGLAARNIRITEKWS